MLASHSNSGGISTRALNSAGVNVLFTDRNQVICYDPPPPRLSFKRDNGFYRVKVKAIERPSSVVFENT